MKKIQLIVFAFAFLGLTVQASETPEVAEGKGTTVELKPGGAVSAFSEEDGFKLTDKATSNLGITFIPLKGTGPWVIPKSALVRIKHSTGVYRKWDGWLTMVLVTVLKETKETITIKSVDLQSQDEVALTGVVFLRMTEADLNADTVDACAH